MMTMVMYQWAGECDYEDDYDEKNNDDENDNNDENADDDEGCVWAGGCLPRERQQVSWRKTLRPAASTSMSASTSTNIFNVYFQ